MGKDERGAPTPFNLLSIVLYPFPKSWLTNIFGRPKARGFAAGMGREATLRLQARERRYARAYDEKTLRGDGMRADARLAAIHESMPVLQKVSQRCEALESEVMRMSSRLENVSMPNAKVDHLVHLMEKSSGAGGMVSSITGVFPSMPSSSWAGDWDGRIEIETRDNSGIRVPTLPTPAAGRRAMPSCGILSPPCGAATRPSKKTYLSSVSSTLGFG